MSLRSPNLRWFLRICFSAAGLVSASLTIWIFYWHPWLGGISRLDDWLRKNRCAISSLCPQGFLKISQPGILAALLAVLFFILALWRWRGILISDERPVQFYSLSWQSQRMRGVLLAATIGLVAIVYQGYRVLTGHTSEPLPWLVGMGAFLIAAVVWDAVRPRDLARTLADMTVAIGIVLIILGVACLMVERRTAVPLLISGVASFVAGSWWTVRVGSSVNPLEHSVMLALALVALFLAMGRVWSWRFAFIGDEWSFFNAARAYIHHPVVSNLLGLRNPNDYHTILSSVIQAQVMQIAGENVYGWRLSSALPFVLSVPPIYIFIRWLAGRGAAFLGAGLFAGSHMLITFSMVAYNNTQALLPLTLGLGLFAFASKRTNVLRYLLIGIFLGLGFFLFGLARLVVIPVGIFLLAFAWPGYKRNLLSWVAVIAGGLSAGVPMVLNLANWQTMLKATPVQTELHSIGRDAQMARNIFAGLLTFLSGARSSHFVAGPHVDPLTAILMLIGLAYVLVNLAHHKRARVWLAASTLFAIAVSGIQQYSVVSNTRMFILPPVYMIFAGLGGVALAHLWLPEDAKARSTLLGIMVAAGVALNQFHIERISLPNSGIPVEALVVQQIQETAAVDQGGMPVFIVLGGSPNPLENTIARAYDVGRERLIFLSETEALDLPYLCRADKGAAMALVGARASQLDLLRQRIAECWPNYKESDVVNSVGEVWLHRFLTERGQQEVNLPVVQRFSERQDPDTLLVPDPGDIVVDAKGATYVLSVAEAQVYRFAQDGTLLRRFKLIQDGPSAMALTPEGLLLVTSTGKGSRLVWYDGVGTVARQAPPDLGIGVPRAVAVAADGEVFVTDVAGARVLRLTAGGKVTGELGKGLIKRPSSLAIGLGETLWVLDAGGKLYQVTLQEDKIVRTLPVPSSSPEHGWRMLQAVNGDLIMTEPEKKRVIRRDINGHLVRVWNGFERPFGLRTDAVGRLFISDIELGEVGILPRISEPPRLIAAVVREDVKPLPLASPTTSAQATHPVAEDTVERPGLSPQMEPLTPAIEKGRMDGMTIISGLEGSTLSRPQGIAISRNGRIYVTDTGNYRLLVFDEDGTFVAQVNSGKEPFIDLADVAIDSRGQVYVVDAGRPSLSVFDADGRYLRDIPIEGKYVSRSRGLAVDNQDQLWIAATSQGTITSLDTDGNVLLEIPVLSGSQSQPVDVAVGPEGDIYVTEATLSKLIHYGPEGKVLGVWNISPAGTVDGPHLAISASGDLYVTEPEAKRILQMNPEGKIMQEWDLHFGERLEIKPVGIAIDPRGHVWIVDSGGGNIVALPLGK